MSVSTLAHPQRRSTGRLWLALLLLIGAGVGLAWFGAGSLRGETPRARLVLNHLNPLVRRIASLPNTELAGTAVEALYGQSLLMARRPLRPADSALLNRAFAGLLEWSTLPGGGAYEGDEAR